MREKRLGRDNLDRYRDYLFQEERAPSTIEKYLLGFLGLEDCRVKFLKVQRRAFRDASRDLGRDDYQRLLDAAQQRNQTRLALLLETICATGVRVSEVRFVTVEAARLGRADVALKGKIRTILLPNKLCRKLLKYAGKQKIASGEIFLTRGGNSLSRKQIWREMKGICAAIVKLADVLGHSSVDTTHIYLITTGAEHASSWNGWGWSVRGQNTQFATVFGAIQQLEPQKIHQNTRRWSADAKRTRK